MYPRIRDQDELPRRLWKSPDIVRCTFAERQADFRSACCSLAEAPGIDVSGDELEKTLRRGVDVLLDRSDLATKVRTQCVEAQVKTKLLES